MKNIRVYLSLGGNEGQALLRLQQACLLLARNPNFHDLKISHFYRTAPVQVETSSWFVNAVCSFQTNLSPQTTFEIIQMIENKLGKSPKPKNASRPIDIDLLFYGPHLYQDQELEIPHPRWKERLFVLIPLADLTREISIQGQKNFEHYILQDLIQPLIIQSPQAVSLLEKNPTLQVIYS